MAQKEILRVYDEAVIKFFRDKLNTVPNLDISNRIIFASPERPFGFDNPSAAGDSKTDSARAVQTLNTPIATITRLNLIYALARANNVPWELVRYWDAEKKFAISSKPVHPWDIYYQVDIHGRFRQDLNWTLKWFLYNPNPIWTLPVDFGYPWGKQNINVMFSDILDNSELETEEHERWIRHTIRFTLEAWMFEIFDNPNDIPYDGLDPNANTIRQRTAQEVNVIYEIDEDPELTRLKGNKDGTVDIETEVI